MLLQLGILLTCILVGARRGGIALGTVSGIGLVLFVFLFGMPPGQPPAVSKVWKKLRRKGRPEPVAPVRQAK